MSGASEWGPVIEHDGKGRPVAVGVVVWVEFEARPGRLFEEVLTVTADMMSWDWANWLKRAPCGCFILAIRRYRILKPRALLDLIDMVENLPAPVVPVATPEGV